MAKEMRNEIIKLKKDVLDMAELAENMLDDAVEALINTDLELAETVDPKKHKLRKFDENIEKESLRTIALYQPMAIDLRRLASILKIITYLYRIGRYGKDIAAVVEEFTGKHSYSEFIGINHMWEHVRTMIKDAMDSFDSETTSKLEDFEKRDNEIDQMRWSIFRESVSYMMEDPKNITASAHLMMIARYLERCGDHACKIAEKTYYLVEGTHKEIS
jgi:phosphate transport system protein